MPLWIRTAIRYVLSLQHTFEHVVGSRST